MTSPYVQPPAIDNGARFNATASPAGWLRDNIRAWWNAAIDTLSRGSPMPMGARDAYVREPIRQPAPNGGWEFILTRRYDRGAYAYGVRGGALTYDPLGAGIVTTRPFDPTAPAAIKVPFGDAIFWEPQSINRGRVPTSGAPIYTPAQIAALYNNPALAGGAGGNPQFIAPGEGGFGS